MIKAKETTYVTAKEIAVNAGVSLEALETVLNSDPFVTAVMIDGVVKWELQDAIAACCRFSNKVRDSLHVPADRGKVTMLPVPQFHTTQPAPTPEPAVEVKPKRQHRRLTPERIERAERLIAAAIEMNGNMTISQIAEQVGETTTVVARSNAWKTLSPRTRKEASEDAQDTQEIQETQD